LLERVGLVEALSNEESAMTLLAPSESDFAKMDPEELAFLQLPDNQDLLVDVLRYHVLLDQFLFSPAFEEGQELTTMANGATITVTRVDPLTFNDQATVTAADILAIN
jgi:uncharacterized surface protein with fasciclin (FAS1) repeats